MFSGLNLAKFASIFAILTRNGRVSDLVVVIVVVVAAVVVVLVLVVVDDDDADDDVVVKLIQVTSVKAH